MPKESLPKRVDLSWDSVVLEYNIFKEMCSSTYWVIKNQNKIQGNGKPSLDLKRDSLNAILFLRDELMKTKSDRIWGLTFTLFSTGKFNIKYDYNKPEGYEETDELISGDEINQSINKIAP